MDNKPSFWLFLKALNTKDNLYGTFFEVNDTKNQKQTVYEKLPKRKRVLLIALFFLLLVPIALLPLQDKVIVERLQMWPNLIYDIIVLEYIIVIPLFIFAIFLVYRTIDFSVVSSDMPYKKKSKCVRILYWIYKAAFGVMVILVVLSTYSFACIRYLTDSTAHDNNNISLYADEYEDIVFEGDVAFGLIGYQEFNEDEFMRMEIETKKTPKAITVYFNEQEIKSYKVKTAYTLYASRYISKFWEEDYLKRRVYVLIPYDELEETNTLKVVCGEKEKAWTISIEYENVTAQ